ncbi:MAG: uracil phosphoribosyltransferase [Flavobacteriaceae bacterium]|nr:uracil phosphoribosyltransferase [Bacteroidia bacterium]NNF83159.1 uracil phosphoribosyltransferase [Flavobacteriaceae bacterium]NNK70103.1 uracil phosphoribosyltransferase [Flavobacteriaceae bacterium]
MQIHRLSSKNTILNTFLSEIRDKSIQKDRLRFRKNIYRVSQILCYEMSAYLDFREQDIKTTLGSKTVELATQDLVVCSILRAGLSMHQAVLDSFDQADNAFVSAYRKHDADDPSQFEIIIEYLACPDLEGKTLVLVDPMLASGKSFTLAFEALLTYGQPKSIHLLSIIAAKEGVDYVSEKFPKGTNLWLGDLDPELNDYGYIVPGLGDAGDLAFGTKLQH